jgi:DNA-binding transcriptional ArsR family regulator
MTDQLRIFKALANADRIKIMELLADGPDGTSLKPGTIIKLDGVDFVVQPNRLSVLDIARHIGLSQSQTSQHLATLRRAGLITTRKSGTTVFNQIDPVVNWPIKVFE